MSKSQNEKSTTSTPSVKLPPIPDSEKIEARKRLDLAKLHLILEHPFFGILSTKLIAIENDTWCQTMAVDGRHLYYNPRFVMGYKDELREEATKRIREAKPDVTDEQLDDFLDGLSDDNMIAVVCHEILHCAFNHFLRRGQRDPQLYNCAADYEINQIIKRDKIGEIGKNWLFREDFDTLNAEQIYVILLKERDQNKSPGSTIDQHMMPGGDSSPDKKVGTIGDILADNPDAMPDISEEEMQDYMDDFENTIRAAASQEASSVPSEIKQMIQDLNEPKIDWREKLDRTLRTFIKYDSSYLKPSRRSWYSGVIMPGLMPADQIDICVAVDTSGSISDEMLRDFLSEVYGMSKQFSQFKIRLLCFDTSVHNPQDYDENNIEQLLSYEVGGRGGTDFMAVWQHMIDDDYKPHQLIMFTDGYPCNEWGISDYCKTLFVLHGTKTIVPPFGDVTYYDDYE